MCLLVTGEGMTAGRLCDFLRCLSYYCRIGYSPLFYARKLICLNSYFDTEIVHSEDR